MKNVRTSSNTKLPKGYKQYAILGQLGHLILPARSKKEAEGMFSKQFDIAKYPVTLFKQ